MAQRTDEIDGDSPVAEAACGMAEEGHAVRRLVMPDGHDRSQWSGHDHGIAGVYERVSEGKHGSEFARVGSHAMET